VPVAAAPLGTAVVQALKQEAPSSQDRSKAVAAAHSAPTVQRASNQLLQDAQPALQRPSTALREQQQQQGAGQSQPPPQAPRNSSTQPLLDIEGQRYAPPVPTHDGPEAQCKDKVVAFFKVCSQIGHIFMTVWIAANFQDWLEIDEDCSDVGSCLEDNLPVLKFWVTIPMGIFAIYETGKHWYHGTYFPMTASDSFYMLRFGRRQDKSPLAVRRGTLVVMMLLSFFLSVLSLVNYIGVYIQVCPLSLSSEFCTRDNWNHTSGFQKKVLWVQLVLYAVSVLSKIKTFALICVFAVLSIFGLLGLGIVTFGIGWIVLCAGFRSGGLRQDTKVGCISLRLVYDFIAFFYTRA